MVDLSLSSSGVASRSVAGQRFNRSNVSMGNKSLVAHDNCDVEAVAESLSWLEALTAAFHRGRGDTWEAARDRAAREAGIASSYAKRLWHRSSTMKDVSGHVYRNLQIAYVRMCESNERIAEQHRLARIAIQGTNETDRERTLQGE